MQGIRPDNLSNEELLGYVYIMGHDKLPADWIRVLVERFAALLDDNK